MVIHLVNVSVHSDSAWSTKGRHNWILSFHPSMQLPQRIPETTPIHVCVRFVSPPGCDPLPLNQPVCVECMASVHCYTYVLLLHTCAVCVADAAACLQRTIVLLLLRCANAAVQQQSSPQVVLAAAPPQLPAPLAQQTCRQCMQSFTQTAD
jgi:hypothetical protein